MRQKTNNLLILCSSWLLETLCSDYDDGILGNSAGRLVRIGGPRAQNKDLCWSKKKGMKSYGFGFRASYTHSFYVIFHFLVHSILHFSGLLYLHPKP